MLTNLKVFNALLNEWSQFSVEQLKLDLERTRETLNENLARALKTIMKDEDVNE